MENLINALSFGGILSDKELDYVAGLYEAKTYKPGDHFLSIGKISNLIGFKVPQQYIASYLQITQQSFSRIRRELA
ncbi:hypothetical protein SAMN05443144_105181 [Fodinibius roseus]|uniref:Uncharacterized protein n=1 Tax=Fodinibius roseus TaxID=1194090 RepID=A0A1M4YY11_9BACT|nr:hypothetical protein [Fodinibius roseus]SHF10226.1 hypothetical protein SAMN05443144_105181 [Fodinibius roseus]